MSFGDRLRTTRKEKGYSQEQLAEELNVSRQSVTKWETGITFPEIRTMLRLASLLDRDLDWLLYDEKCEDSARQGVHALPMEQIPDRDTLNNIMKQDLLLSIINTLDGFEIVQKIETNEFVGSRTCIFYKGRVFSETTGRESQTNEPISTFSEMSTLEIESLLLPCAAIRKSNIGTQPEVAKKER